MEIRKRKAVALAMASATPNQTFCAMKQEGIVSRRLIAAEITNVSEQRITLALAGPSSDTHAKTVTRESFGLNWQPCKISPKQDQSIKPD